MENEKYIRLNPDGTSELVTVNRAAREVGEGLINQFGATVVRTLKRAFPTPSGVAHLLITDRECYAVARLKEINLLSHYDTAGDKTLTPVFLRETDAAAKDYPLMPLVWPVPEDMVLLFAARLLCHNEPRERIATAPDQSCYLVAYNQKKQAFLLPLPNLYGDAAICMGQFNGQADSAAQAFMLALAQFDKSSWNSDLLENRIDHAQALFRFKEQATETEAIPFQGDWSKHCEKISTPVTLLIAQLL